VAEVSARVIARRPAILLTAAILLALCVLASLFVGSSRIPADQVAHYLLHPDASNVSYNINVLRVQRTIIGVLVGTALAVAGAIMQAVTQGLQFGVAVAVILFGVRTILGELVPAFQGIAAKIVPGAIPALDCPIVFPYAQNAVLIGNDDRYYSSYAIHPKTPAQKSYYKARRLRAPSARRFRSDRS